jgi:hypothetical protein
MVLTDLSLVLDSPIEFGITEFCDIFNIEFFLHFPYNSLVIDQEVDTLFRVEFVRNSLSNRHDLTAKTD